MADLRITPDGLALDEARAPCVVDPVCGKEVDLDRAAAQEDHNGWHHLWDSAGGRRRLCLGMLLMPALGAALMSLGTVIVAINAKLLERARRLVACTAAVAAE